MACRFEHHVDVNTSAVLHFYFAMRWMSTRLDVLTTVVTVTIAVVVTLANNYIAYSYAAIALVYSAKACLTLVHYYYYYYYY